MTVTLMLQQLTPAVSPKKLFLNRHGLIEIIDSSRFIEIETPVHLRYLVIQEKELDI